MHSPQRGVTSRRCGLLPDYFGRLFVVWLANVARVSDATQMAAGKEFQATTLETEKSLAPSTVVVLRTTSGVRVSADLKSRLLAMNDTGTQ